MSLRFDPTDPYPLISKSLVTYAEEKQHAQAVDHFLGYQVDQIEAMLRNEEARENHQAQWIGLAPESLQTPYTELRTMLSLLNLNPNETVVDLGAGYGRMGMVLHRHYPECHFLGIEISRPRVEEGNRVFRMHGVHAQSRLVHGDASDFSFELPDANAYFLYDLSQKSTIIRVIDKLRERARQGPLVVVGRGRGTRDQIERKEPWLSEVVAPKHYGNFSVYRSG